MTRPEMTSSQQERISGSPLAREILGLMLQVDDSVGQPHPRTTDAFTKTGQRKDIVVVPAVHDNLTGDC